MSHSHSRSEADSVGIVVTAETRLWLLAVLFFGVGDTVTTAVGLGLPGVREVGLFRSVITTHGLVAIVGLKLATFAVCYLLWRAVPRPHAVGVPLGLVLLGVPVTGWNVVVLTLAT